MTETERATQDLIDRAGQGDDDARRELLERYRDYLRRMVASRLDRRLAPRLDPSDIVQETLADAAGRMDDYLRNPTLPFFGWLRLIAGEHIRDAHRRHLFAQRRSITRESPGARIHRRIGRRARPPVDGARHQPEQPPGPPGALRTGQGGPGDPVAARTARSWRCGTSSA